MSQLRQSNRPNCWLAVAALISASIIAAGCAMQSTDSQNQRGQDAQTISQTGAKQSGNGHYEDVEKHGEMAMGFSQLTTTHHFRLASSGGSIEVQTKNATDTATRDQIRLHLQHISVAFEHGDFSSPMITHGRVPPGVPAMQELKQNITYRYEETARGAKVMITTENSEAVKAIHDFLRFQIQDHRTGDPETVQK